MEQGAESQGFQFGQAYRIIDGHGETLHSIKARENQAPKECLQIVACLDEGLRCLTNDLPLRHVGGAHGAFVCIAFLRRFEERLLSEDVEYVLRHR